MGKKSTSKRRKKKSKKALYNVMLAVFIVIFIVALTLVLQDIIPRIKASGEINGLRDIKPTSEVVDDNLKNYDELKAINGDYLFWVQIKGTDIDLPVVQTDDNAYYLTWTFMGEYNDAGTLFLDCDNSPLLTDQNSVIYGHARLDGTMFGGIKKYKNQSYYEEHPFITIFTKDSIYYYQIFSLNTLDATYDYRTPNYGSSFMSFIDAIRSGSYITTSANVNSNSRIITLSTCTSGETDLRLVLFGVLINPDGKVMDLSNIPL